MPPAEPFDDPFAPLTEDQIWDLGFIVSMRMLEEGDAPVSDEKAQELQETEVRLRDAGIDIDHLLSQRERVIAARQARSEAVVQTLDAQQIRMPGYLLPLDFEGTLVKEFLLVPYVGACIHTPPPPPNQIVYVRTDEGYQSEGLFAPVWVAGTMSVERQTREIFLVDGATDVAVGYSVQAEVITPYE